MRLASFILLFVSLFVINESNAQTAKLPLVRHHHKFIVIAHRGDHTNAPENTIVAYKNAIKIGADFIEVDLRTTKDSQLVVMHDATINRITGINGSIQNMTFDSLRKLEVRESKHPEWGNHVIPTLAFVFSNNIV